MYFARILILHAKFHQNSNFCFRKERRFSDMKTSTTTQGLKVCNKVESTVIIQRITYELIIGSESSEAFH